MVDLSTIFHISIFYLYFIIWFNSFDFIAPTCIKFIKFLFKKLNLVVWYHTTTILKGDLNYYLIRKLINNPEKVYNNSININLSQQIEYISISFIISSLMTLKKKKIYHISLYLSITFSFSYLNIYIYIYIIMLIRNYNFNKI